MRVCGQEFTPAVLDRIRATVLAEPQISRRALSRRVCEWLGWRSGSGAWQHGGCRKALVALERREVLELPCPQRVFAARQTPAMEVDVAQVCTTLEALGAVELVAIGSHRSREAKLWRALMQRYHYLGDKPLCGAQIRYLIRSERHGWLGAMAFNSAGWALRARDEFIGWSEAARRQQLPRVVCNSRFVIVPGVQVANLASYVLGCVARQLPRDWEARYGVAPVLMETFVDPRRFDGTCYRAANWVEVGTSAGRRDGIAKTLLLYPLHPQWRETLCAAAPIRLGEPARAQLPTPAAWSAAEFATLRVYDERLKRRLFLIAEDFYNQPQANVPQACGSPARTRGTYRFLQNHKITMDVILTPHLESTITRIKAHKIVLAPQDTTTLNYSHHPGTIGLGPVNTKTDQATGLMLHDTLAFSEHGTPLGVIDAQCWARDPHDHGKSARRKEVAIEHKESIKWLRSYRKLAAVQALCPETMLVSVGDRESDLHDLFAEAAHTPAGPQLLVRAERSRARRVEDESLWSFVSAQAVAGTLTLTLPKRGKRGARQAVLEVRFSEVELQAPKHSPLPAVRLWAVHLLEDAAEDGGEPIEWMLLTTVPVTTFQQAVQRAEWYAARWGIEVFHRTLKSGCRIKDRQLGTAERLQACLGIDMVVAWRIYHLTMLGREVPQHPCTVFFEEVEWKALHCYHYKTPLTPDEPPSMGEAIRMLGALGGHLGRKSDAPPGTQVLWRGLQRLDTAAQMYMVFTQSPAPNSWCSYPDGYLPPPNAP
ncbi:MAG: IS4 family transposase [Gammaproteobacteria bacterium]